MARVRPTEASDSPSEPDVPRADQLWADWERERLSGIQWLVALATGTLRRLPGAATVLWVAFLLFAIAGFGHNQLQQRVIELEDQVAAREGEIELVRLQLARANRILKESGRRDIPADLAGAIYDAAEVEGISTDIAFSLVDVESDFMRRAVSPAGAVGLTQVMPRTAFWLDPKLRYADLFERDTNLRLGFRYLREMIHHYDGNLDLALLAYNRGPGRVNSILRGGGNPSNGYERAVLRGR